MKPLAAAALHFGVPKKQRGPASSARSSRVDRPSMVGRLILGVLLALSAPALSALRAAAHSEVVNSDPAPGAVLATPPAAVFIEFDGPLSQESTITVQDATFQPMQQGETIIVDPQDPHVMAVNLPPLAPGEYTVQWQSVDPQDGHTASGSYAFAVREPGPSRAWNLLVLAAAVALVVLVVAWLRRRGSPAER